jgi:RNA polymerase primary sigma factor
MSVVNNNKKTLAKIQFKYSQTQKQQYSQGSVQDYLQTIGKIPLLGAEEEIELSRQVRDLLELERIYQQLAEKLGRQPSEREWSQELNLTISAFRSRLHFGRQAKNKMIQANLRLVVFIAKKYLNRGLSLPDLIQEGNLGLIRAVEKFEPEKGCKVSTYAYWWIRQSITRAITEQSRTIRLPIHIYDKLWLIKKTFKLLSQKLQRQPNEVEIAESLNITVEQLRFLLRAAQVPFSLETPIDREEDSRLLGENIKSDFPTPEEFIFKELRLEEVENILSCLSSKEQEILRLRYGLDGGFVKTPEEISEILNLSRQDIHRIRANAMNKLRRLCLDYNAEEYLL